MPFSRCRRPGLHLDDQPARPPATGRRPRCGPGPRSPTSSSSSSTPRCCGWDPRRGGSSRSSPRRCGARRPPGRRFMPAMHEMAELAPRDVVARAIVGRMAATGADHVLLDARHLGRSFLRERFPGIGAAAGRARLRPGRGPGAGGASAALPLGRGADRPRRPHVAARPVRRGGDVVHRGAPGCTAPTGWPRTPCWRAWSSPTASPAMCVAYHGRRAAVRRAGRVVRCRCPGPGGVAGRRPAGSERRAGRRPVGEGLAEAARALAAVPTSDATAEPATAEWEATNLHQVATALTLVAALRTETRGGHLRVGLPEADDDRWLVRQVVALDDEARLAVRERVSDGSSGPVSTSRSEGCPRGGSRRSPW